MSQDALYSHTNVISISVSDKDETTTVVLSLVPEYVENVNYKYPQAKIKLEKESGKSMIIGVKPMFDS